MFIWRKLGSIIYQIISPLYPSIHICTCIWISNCPFLSLFPFSTKSTSAAHSSTKRDNISVNRHVANMPLNTSGSDDDAFLLNTHRLHDDRFCDSRSLEPNYPCCLSLTGGTNTPYQEFGGSSRQELKYRGYSYQNKCITMAVPINDLHSPSQV